MACAPRDDERPLMVLLGEAGGLQRLCGSTRGFGFQG